jgi:AraC family transcriptional regulator
MSTRMKTPNEKYYRPRGLLAGFHAQEPESAVPELVHIGEQWAPGAFYIKEHAHEVWEFYVQVSGESLWDAPPSQGKSRRDATYELRPGCFFAVAPGVRHKMHDHAPGKHHFYFAAVNLDEVLARHAPLRELWHGRRVVFCENGENLIAPFRQLVREVSLEMPQRALGIRLALDGLVLEASRLLDESSTHNAPMLGHPAVARVKQLLDSQPQRNWTLKELAHETGLSPNHLAERFADEIGVPPRRYLLQRRIERAQELLRLSDIPVTDLAMELGFSSSQHFASAFRKTTGTTASQFRAQNRKRHDAM